MSPEKVVKEAFWLAYQACGGPSGMGAFQARAMATKDEVWANLRSCGDYGKDANEIMRHNRPGKAYGNYIFGRMVKLGIEWDDKSVVVRDEEPYINY